MKQAILMAGGQGTRLRPITAVLPKPLVPIGEISVLEMVLRQLAWYGFEEGILCLGAKAEVIMAVVGDGARLGVTVRYFTEEKPLGTIGALPLLDGLEDSFLVMNGDVCTDLDFGSMLEWHRAHDAPASVAAYPRREQLELGVLDLDDGEERLVGFREKPSYDLRVAMGVNAFDRSLLEEVPRGEPFGFDQLMMAMLAGEREVRVFTYDGFWLDIGRPDDYQRMLDEFPARRGALLPDEPNESDRPAERP